MKAVFAIIITVLAALSLSGCGGGGVPTAAPTAAPTAPFPMEICGEMKLAPLYCNIWSVAWAPDGSSVIAGGQFGINSYSPTTGENNWKGKKSYLPGMRGVAYSPDGAHVATGGEDYIVRIWDARPRDGSYHECLRTLTGHKNSVTAVAYRPDGARVVSASRDNTVRVWDAVTGASLLTWSFGGGGGNFEALAAYSPDGASIIATSDEGNVCIYDASTGTFLREIPCAFSCVSAAYSPDGASIVAAYSLGDLRIWDAARVPLGRVVTLKGPLGRVNSAAFSPDGATIVSASDDRTLRLWNSSTGECLRTLEGFTAGVSSAAFSPDGAFILSGEITTGTLRMWDVVWHGPTCPCRIWDASLGCTCVPMPQISI